MFSRSECLRTVEAPRSFLEPLAEHPTAKVGLMPRRPTLFERVHELERIEALLHALQASEGQVLSIEGAPGIGKTALLRHAEARAAAMGFRVLTATATEMEREFAYGVVRQHLEPELIRPEGREQVFRGPASLAASALGGTVGAGATRGLAFAVLHGLFWSYLNVASEKPLLATVDDLHWADRPSLRLLVYLVRRLEGIPLSLILTAREDEEATDWKLTTELTSSATESLRPLSLSVQGVGQLIEVGLGIAPDARFSAECHSAGRGNPFVTRELIDAIRREGIDPTAEDALRVPGLIPTNVLRVTLLRLEQLGSDATEVVKAMAVFGDRAERRHVAMVSGVEGTRLAGALDRLTNAGVLAGGEPVAFQHPLTRRVVYESMPRAERTRRHLLAAAELQRDGAAPEAVAAHVLSSDPIAADWATGVLLEAAAAAAKRGAPEVSGAYLRRALQEPLDETTRAEVLLDTGTMEFHAGDDGAVEHLRAALRLTREPRDKAIAALSLAAALTAQGRVAEAVEALQTTHPELASDRRLRSVVEAAAVGEGLLDAMLFPALRPQLQRLRKDIDRGRQTSATALATAAVHAAMANEPANVAVSLARRALEEENPADPLSAVAPSFFHACGAFVAADELDDAKALYDGAIRDATELGSLTQLSIAQAWRAFVLVRLGFVVAAEADAELVLSREPASLERFFIPLAEAVRVEALIEQDRAAEVPSSGSAGAVGDLSSSLYSALHDYARGRLHYVQRRYAEGAEQLLSAGQLLQRLGATSPSIAPWRSEAALAYAASGEATRAHELANEELRLAQAFGRPRAVGVALRAKGLICGGRAGMRLLEEACRVLRSSPAKLDYARALTDRGAALRRARQRTTAREPLREALDLATRLGATKARKRAETELRAAGGRPRRHVLSGVESLTASERRVAELAADGLTNRDIAQALFITPRTVEGHLTHIYRKLDVSSRGELSAVVGTAAA